MRNPSRISWGRWGNNSCKNGQRQPCKMYTFLATPMAQSSSIRYCRRNPEVQRSKTRRIEHGRPLSKRFDVVTGSLEGLVAPHTCRRGQIKPVVRIEVCQLRHLVSYISFVAVRSNVARHGCIYLTREFLEGIFLHSPTRLLL